MTVWVQKARTFTSHRSAPTLTIPIPNLAADILRCSSIVHAGGAFGREGMKKSMSASKSIFPASVFLQGDTLRRAGLLRKEEGICWHDL